MQPPPLNLQFSITQSAIIDVGLLVAGRVATSRMQRPVWISSPSTTIPLIPEPRLHWKIGHPSGPRTTVVGGPMRFARSVTGRPTYAAKPVCAGAALQAKIVIPRKIRSDFMAILDPSGMSKNSDLVPLILKLSKNYTRIRNAHPFPKVDPKLFERRMCRRVGPGGFRRINDDSILKAAPKPNRRRNNKRASEQNAHAKSSSDFVDTNVPWLRPPHCVLRAIAEKKNKCPHQALGPIVEPALLELAEARTATRRNL
jgi:hypothetical protein